MIAQIIEPIGLKFAPQLLITGAYQRLHKIGYWWSYHRTVHELGRLDSHLLKDLGIQRSEIQCVARAAIQGKRRRQNEQQFRG